MGLVGASAFAAPRSAFGPGEQTTYEVRYFGVPAGLGQITVGWSLEKEDHTVWPLICVGETTSIAQVYQVHDRFTSYWDPLTQRSVGSDFVVDENHQRRRERYRYDPELRKAFATKQKEGFAPGESSYDIEPNTLDLAAAGFWLRNVPLEAGATHEVPLFTGIHHYLMKATVEGRQSLTTPLGTFDVWRVAVNGEFNGNVATKGRIHVYYTADQRQLPIRAEAEFVIGTVVADAVQYLPGRSTP